MNKMLPTIIIVLLIALGAGYFISTRNSVPPVTTGTPQPGTGSGESLEVPVQGTGASEMIVVPQGSTGTTSPVVDSGTARKTFTVEGSPFKFAPNKIEVKKGDTVEIVFKNMEGFHDFVLDEFNVKTQQIGAGKSETVTFVADQAGTFEYYCSVGSHRAQGMVGTLTVTE